MSNTKNEVVTVPIDGREFTGEKIGEDVWFTAERVADMLGYEDKDGVLELYRRHKAEFFAHETCTLKLWVQVGESRQRRLVRLFTLTGIDHLAILAQTEVGVRVRRDIVKLKKDVREGNLAVVKRADFEALRSEFEALKRRLGNVEADKAAFRQIGKDIGAKISAAFREQRRAKEIERQAEIFEQGRLLGLVERRLTRSEERIIAAVAAAGGFDSVRALALKIGQPIGATGEDVGALATRGLLHREGGQIRIKPQAATTGNGGVS